MRYLDPKNDLTFKKVFGKHPHLLKSFLNALIPLKEDQIIVDLEYLPTELVPELPLLKHSIVDVRCLDNFGNQFIVEMQMFWTDSFKNRVLFNASKAYVQQLNKGMDYRSLNKVYALSLVNEDFEKDTEEFYHHYSIVHSMLNDKKIEGLEFVFVEIPKFKAKRISDKKMQVLWLKYLSEIDQEVDQPDIDLVAIPEINEALELLKASAFTKKELETYDKYWDSISSERTLISSAEREGLEKGEKIGLEKGEKLGLEKGEKLGLEKGEKLGREKGEKIGFEKAQQQFLEEEKAKNLELNKNLILNMHKEGFNELIIQKITGLDIIFIQEILNNNKI